jgi:hypothetical protein
MSSLELGMELGVVVEENGGTNDMSMWERQMSGRVADVTDILLSLTTVKDVMVTMNADWWNWEDEVPTVRVKGRIFKWVSKDWGRRIRWWTGHVRCVRSIGLVQGLYFERQVAE